MFFLLLSVGSGGLPSVSMEQITARLAAAKKSLSNAGACHKAVSSVQADCVKALLQESAASLSAVDKADVMDELANTGFTDGDLHDLYSALTAKKQKKEHGAMQDYTNLLDMFSEKRWEKLEADETTRKARLQMIFEHAADLGCVSPSESTKMAWAQALDSLGNKPYSSRSLDEVRVEWKRFKRVSAPPARCPQFPKLPPYAELPDECKALFHDGPPRERKVGADALPLERMRKRVPTLRVGASEHGGGVGGGAFLTDANMGQMQMMANMMMQSMSALQKRADEQDKLIGSLLGGGHMLGNAQQAAEDKRARMLKAAEKRFAQKDESVEQKLAIMDGKADASDDNVADQKCCELAAWFFAWPFQFLNGSSKPGAFQTKADRRAEICFLLAVRGSVILRALMSQHFGPRYDASY